MAFTEKLQDSQGFGHQLGLQFGEFMRRRGGVDLGLKDVLDLCEELLREGRGEEEIVYGFLDFDVAALQKPYKELHEFE